MCAAKDEPLTGQSGAGTGRDHVVMFSGGAGSWAAAKRVAEAMPESDRLTLLFADTLTEDPDLYRFLDEAAANVGGTLVRLSDGRDIWQVFRDVRYLGNSRIDPCSFHLKRKAMRDWIEAHCDPATTVCYLGYDWTEAHRGVKAARYWEPWQVAAPMCDAPLLSKDAVLAWMRAEGIDPPRLYALGFAHNNCGGGCVKAGIGHWAHVLSVLPDLYATWEAEEQAMRNYLDADVSMLVDRTLDGILAHVGLTREEVKQPIIGRDKDGDSILGDWISKATGERLPRRVPLTLRALRERIERKAEVDLYDIGGCGCAIGDPDEDARVIALGMPGLRAPEEAA